MENITTGCNAKFSHHSVQIVRVENKCKVWTPKPPDPAIDSNTHTARWRYEAAIYTVHHFANYFNKQIHKLDHHYLHTKHYQLILTVTSLQIIKQDTLTEILPKSVKLKKRRQ